MNNQMNRMNPNPTKNENIIITGPRTRLSYVHLFEMRSFDGVDPAYSVCLIIPKDDVRTLKRVWNAIAAASEAGNYVLAGEDGVIPKRKELHLPTHDGDEERPGDPAYENAFYLNARCTDPPKLFDKDGIEITDRRKLYSGCYAKCKLRFFAYNHGPENRGIAVTLLGLRKAADGERLGAPACTAADFEADDVFPEEEDFLP